MMTKDLAIHALDALAYTTDPDSPHYEDQLAAIAALTKYIDAPEPTVPDQMQDWAGMDGAIAFHLIERHADNWADIGKMMGEWLEANQPAECKPLPIEGTEAATTAINAMLKEYGYPCSPANAARAGYRAARLLANSPAVREPLTVEQERKAFELWLNPGCHDGNVSPWIEPGRYEKETHQLAYLAWKEASTRAIEAAVRAKP